MRMSRALRGFFAVLAMTLGLGCDRPRTGLTPPQTDRSSAAPALRVHWIGRAQITNDLRGLGLTRVWRLPESTRIETRVLDRLVGVLQGSGLLNTQLSAQALRPLLDDLVQSEFYLEYGGSTAAEGSGMLAVAIRLDAERSAAWQSAASGALAGNVNSAPNAGKAPALFQVTSGNGWTLAGIARGSNSLLNAFSSRLQGGQTPFAVSSNYLWLEARINPRTLLDGRTNQAQSGLLNSQPLPAELLLSILGSGDQVITRIDGTFASRLPFELKPWKIPTLFIREPLVGFTAARGFGSWLAPLKEWKSLSQDPAPDQAFFWSQNGSPFFLAAAFLLPASTNFGDQLQEFCQRTANPWIASNAFGKIEVSTNLNGLVWSGLPYLAPVFRTVNTAEGSFLLGSAVPELPTNGPPASEVFWQITDQNNLLYYDWELTGARVQAGVYLSQLARLIFHHPQLGTNSASLGWFQAAAPYLGNCLSTLAPSGTNQLVFSRRSTIGLSALELHLLAQWLED